MFHPNTEYITILLTWDYVKQFIKIFFVLSDNAEEKKGKCFLEWLIYSFTTQQSKSQTHKALLKEMQVKTCYTFAYSTSLFMCKNGTCVCLCVCEVSLKDAHNHKVFRSASFTRGRFPTDSGSIIHVSHGTVCGNQFLIMPIVTLPAGRRREEGNGPVCSGGSWHRPGQTRSGHCPRK